MKKLFTTLMVLIAFNIVAQENIKYQKPSKEILDLVEYERAPSVLYNDQKTHMIFLYRDNYKTIEDLSAKEMRLGGLRIDPATNIGSRVTYYNNVKIKNLKENKAEIKQIQGLPQTPKLSNINWSPNQKKVALTNTTRTGVELWVLDVESATVEKFSDATLNANIGGVITWSTDSQSMFVKMISKNRKPLIDTNNVVPDGPTVSTNFGAKAQNRTYQDL